MLISHTSLRPFSHRSPTAMPNRVPRVLARRRSPRCWHVPCAGVGVACGGRSHSWGGHQNGLRGGTDDPVDHDLHVDRRLRRGDLVPHGSGRLHGGRRRARDHRHRPRRQSSFNGGVVTNARAQGRNVMHVNNVIIQAVGFAFTWLRLSNSRPRRSGRTLLRRCRRHRDQRHCSGHHPALRLPNRQRDPCQRTCRDSTHGHAHRRHRDGLS